MRKLVLGLIALTSVQFAFVTYMMVLQSPMEATKEPVLIQPAPNTQELVRLDHSNAPVEVVSKPEVVAPRTEPRHITPARFAVRAPEPVAKLDGSLAAAASKPAFTPATSTAAAGDFESVVIRYNPKPDTVDCETRELAKPKKRSYVAKAISVIKKPWDGLKAIGSKLN